MNIKNITLVACLSIGSLYASYGFVPNDSTYTNQTMVNKYYLAQLSYDETTTLSQIITKMLSNKIFIKETNMFEMGKTKVYTTDLLKKLLEYLQGLKPYSNTYFDNNSNKLGDAGIAGIIKDNIKNNIDNLSLSTNIKNNIVNSIKNQTFFEVATNIDKNLDLLKHTSKKTEVVDNIIKDFDKLFSKYVNDISKLNIKLLKSYNAKTKDILIKDYRIDTKTDILTLLQIFKKYINKNGKIY